MLDPLQDFLGAGGPVVGLLILMSIGAVAIILMKLWQFADVALWHRRAARDAVDLYRRGHPDDALAVAEASRNPAAEALSRALRGRQRGLSEARVREEVARTGQDALFALRSQFRTLELIAAIAPLLGLFGTVLGMIEAFRELEAAGSQVNLAILSGGIWQALLTTAAGLAVAMPVLAAHTWLERQVDGLAHDMNMVATQVFTEDLSAHAVRAEREHGAGHAHLQPAQ